MRRTRMLAVLGFAMLAAALMAAFHPQPSNAATVTVLIEPGLLVPRMMAVPAATTVTWVNHMTRRT